MLHYSDLSQAFDPSLSQQPKLALNSHQSHLELSIKTITVLPLVVKNQGSQAVNHVEVAVFMPQGLLYAGASPKGWMCSQREQVLHCISLGALQAGESLELTIPVAATYRMLEVGLSEIEARFINHLGAEFEESIFLDVGMVWSQRAEQN